MEILGIEQRMTDDVVDGMLAALCTCLLLEVAIEWLWSITLALCTLRSRINDDTPGC